MLENWFSFKSKEVREKESKEYENKIFPFGLEQRELAANALMPLMHKKTNRVTTLFGFVSAKQIYLDTDGNEEKQRARLIGCRYYKADEIKYILALVKLDCAIESLDNYPNSDTVRATADAEM
ncbi:MAG: hypothetical protein RR058_06435 [Oscillospiraceae bacterium]